MRLDQWVPHGQRQYMRLQKEGDLDEYSAGNIFYYSVHEAHRRGEEPNPDTAVVTLIIVN